VIEKTASLRSWARQIGISPDTLKRWLAADLGMVMPQVERGAKILIRERDVEIVYRKHVASADWSVIRGRASAA
jgi:predicted site-specific integrase-resolvase